MGERNNRQTAARTHCLAALAMGVMVWLGVGSAARGIVIRDDRSDADAITAAAADDAVGKLLNRNRIDCSATLISSRWVLTAAHCVTDSRHVKFEAAGQRVAADRWYVHSKWNNNERQGYDVGLVRLSRPITTITPATLYRTKDEVGQTAKLVGYGDYGDGLSGSIGFDAQRRAGYNVIDRIENVRAGQPLVLVTDFDMPGSAGIQADEATTASGDSGGPLLIGSAVAGITSWGSSDFSEYGDIARYTRVSSFAKWVDKVMGSRRWARRLALEGHPGDPIDFSDLHARSRAADGLTYAATTTALPEPGSAVLILVASVIVCRRARRALVGDCN